MTDTPNDIVSIAHRFGQDDKILSDETADCLRKWLAMAEAGEIVSVAIAGEATNGDAVTGHSHAAKRYQVIGAISVLQAGLINKVLKDSE